MLGLEIGKGASLAFGYTGASLLLLTLFVEAAHLAKVPAQALAVAASMPFNFIGNKLWTFRSEAERRAVPRP